MFQNTVILPYLPTVEHLGSLQVFTIMNILYLNPYIQVWFLYQKGCGLMNREEALSKASCAASFSVCDWVQPSFQQYLCPWLAIITLKPISWGKGFGVGKH